MGIDAPLSTGFLGARAGPLVRRARAGPLAFRHWLAFINPCALLFTGSDGFMAYVAAKRFNWLRSPSAWERTVVWREKQQAARQNFEAANSSANNAFASASISLVTGMGDVTSKIAVKRIQSERAAKALNTLA